MREFPLRHKFRRMHRLLPEIVSGFLEKTSGHIQSVCGKFGKTFSLVTILEYESFRQFRGTF